MAIPTGTRTHGRGIEVSAGLRVTAGRRGRRARIAFTIVELLVVIVVVGILISMLLMVASHVRDSQKKALTKTLIQNLEVSIDQFAEADPLGRIYNRKDRATFGPYPPYQLDGSESYDDQEIKWIVEPEPSNPDIDERNDSLAQRLAFDMGGEDGLSNVDQYVSDSLDHSDPDINDDNRALYTYLTVFGSDCLSQFPAEQVKPFYKDTDDAEFVNPTGEGTDPGDDGLVDVFGLHDAWGVPFEYMLYVKVELKSNVANPLDPKWVVTDRVPVIRSRGQTLDQYENSFGLDLDSKDIPWIDSRPLPAPIANVDEHDGDFSGSPDPEDGGWIRARAAGHEDQYLYRPAP